MLKKLRIKFICINMTLVTVMLCIILGMVVYFTAESLETESLQMLRAAASAPMGVPNDRPRERTAAYFHVHITDRGEIIGASGNLPELSDGETLAQIVSRTLQIGTRQGVLKEYHLRFVKEQAPMGTSLVYADITAEQKTMEHLIQICLFLGISGFGLFLLLSFFLAGWAVKPVEQAWLQQRQFVADASHELKTPLTVIMTNAELLDSPDLQAQARQDCTEKIMTMSQQMRHLVEGLLELARADNGAVRTAFSKISMSEVTEEGLLPFEPLYFEKGLTLHSAIEPGICVCGSASHLNQVLEILLDNAMKYSFPGSEVHVNLSRQGKHAQLTVSNAGPAIEGEDLKNIFKRFYRVDQSRTRDGSYGLGLSIAETVIREHRGKIWVKSSDGRNTFHVQLPAQ